MSANHRLNQAWNNKIDVLTGVGKFESSMSNLGPINLNTP
jgi:hypothetical protein